MKPQAKSIVGSTRRELQIRMLAARSRLVFDSSDRKTAQLARDDSLSDLVRRLRRDFGRMPA